MHEGKQFRCPLLFCPELKAKDSSSMLSFYCVTRLFLKGFFSLFYRHKVYGQAHIPKGSALIAANHASFYDPPLIAVSFPEEVHFLARATLFSHVGLAWLIRHLNALPLTMEQGDATAFKQTLHWLHEGKKVAIFPEGERTETGEMQPLKAGFSKLALKADCPIIPLYIVGAYAIWPKGKRFPRWRGKTACVIGSPLYIPKDHNRLKKDVQQALTIELHSRLAALKLWYESGAHELPP